MPDNTTKVKFPTIRENINPLEIQSLLYAVSRFFPMVIWVNLTRNTYIMLEYEKFATKKAQISGVFDDLIGIGASTVDPAHKQKFYDTFSRSSLLEAYARGETSVVLEVRQRKDDGEYGWVRTTVIFMTNEENGEVMEITLAQPIEEQKAEKLDNQRLRTVLEMAMLSSYEYICLINIKTGLYELYANDGKKSHRFPDKGEYDKVVILGRDMLIPESDREEFLKNAKLSTILECMEKSNGPYHFRYRINDSPEQHWREAMFHYCLPDEDELLWTIRDVHSEVMAEQAKRDEEMLRRNRERQQLLTWLGFDIIVDIDITTSHAELMGDAKSFLHRDIICEDFPRGEIRAGMVHPEDAQVLGAAMEFTQKEDLFSLDFRYKRGDGNYFWCRCKGLKLMDEEGKPYRCICKLTDIDDQKRSEQNLIQKAQTDSLTGLYNKMTTELLIDNYLSGEGAGGNHAMLVIDVDDFKKVNDQWGHQAGDKLLQALADKFRNSVRSTDIVGRIGGDEFLLFLKNVRSSDEVRQNANLLRERLKSIRIRETGQDYSPVCSIGVSMYPEHGRRYSEIFRLADHALYYVKEHGKDNVFLLYRKEKSAGGTD